ncbi:MAG: 50S ribosomal protein L9 [Actinobacteria bacterium]|jgi:large subunit ribosomal protein L9|nr:50S ribosomal protein L9 [Actinomycetota bacterium]
MKVILKDEVDNLGLAGDVVDVADGYGRNFLLPRGLAILASKGAMKEAEALTRSRKAKESKTLGSAAAAREALEARTLRIEARVDERGNLYGSVSANDVQRVLRERGHEIERKRIELKGTLKTIGTYEIPVRVHPQVTATVTVEIVDAEGRISLRDGAVIDADAIEEVAADVAAGTDTDVDALTEQALEAADALEAEQADAEQAEAGTEETEGAATVTADDEGEDAEEA